MHGLKPQASDFKRRVMAFGLALGLGLASAGRPTPEILSSSGGPSSEFEFSQGLPARSPGVQHLYIVHTNDIHGALLPGTAFWLNPDFPPPLANAPGALVLIRELREEAARKGYGFLLLDGGDVFRGTPLGDFTRGQAVVDYFNLAGYDAIAVGNHDLDLGWWALKELAGRSKMPWVCSNFKVAGTDTPPAFLRDHLLFDRGGVRIGLFSMITKYLRGMVTDSMIGEHEVRLYEDETRRVLSDLRAAGADIIIGLTHIGERHDKRLADSIYGIDVIIGAHSHSGIQPPYTAPGSHTIVQQAYSRGSAVGFLDLSIDTETKKIVGYKGRLINTYGEDVPKDLEYLAHLESLKVKAEEGFDAVIGRSRRELTRAGMEECAAGNLITDAMREYAKADIALHNSAGIRANFPEGDITYRHVYNVDIFGNTLVVGTYTGTQVREMLEVSVNGHHAIFQVSGVRMTYTKKKPIGSRVLTVTVNGQPLDPARNYVVASNSYLAAGSGEYGVFAAAEDLEDTYLPLRDVIAQYIRRHSPVDARVEGRIVLVDK